MIVKPSFFIAAKHLYVLLRHPFRSGLLCLIAVRPSPFSCSAEGPVDFLSANNGLSPHN